MTITDERAATYEDYREELYKACVAFGENVDQHDLYEARRYVFQIQAILDRMIGLARNGR